MTTYKFKIGDKVRVTSTGSSCLGVTIEGRSDRHGAKKNDIVIITGITNEHGAASSDDPRYYGDNFNLRACQIELAPARVELVPGNWYTTNDWTSGSYARFVDLWNNQFRFSECISLGEYRDTGGSWSYYPESTKEVPTSEILPILAKYKPAVTTPLEHSIKAGDAFRCHTDLVMSGSKAIQATRNTIYKSEKDGCFTNNSGNKEHIIPSADFSKWFELIGPKTEAITMQEKKQPSNKDFIVNHWIKVIKDGRDSGISYRIGQYYQISEIKEDSAFIRVRDNDSGKEFQLSISKLPYEGIECEYAGPKRTELNDEVAGGSSIKYRSSAIIRLEKRLEKTKPKLVTAAEQTPVTFSVKSKKKKSFQLITIT